MKKLSIIMSLFFIMACSQKQTTPMPSPEPVPPVEEPTTPPVEEPSEPPVEEPCKENCGETPNPDPSPTPTPVPLPPPSTGKYPTYPGCETPEGYAYKRTLTVQSSQLQSMLDSKQIQSGDHVIIQAGTSGRISIAGNKHTQLTSATEWTWLDFQGTQTNGISIQNGASKILVTGMSALHKSKNGFVTHIVSSKDVVIANNSIQSSTTNNLTIAEWKSLSSGIWSRTGNCVSLINNNITNVRHGINITTDISQPPANNSFVLAEGNTIKNLSADGFRMNASKVIIRNNKILDGYVSGADGDGNHDDFIQGFALNGSVFQDILVEGNYFIENTSPLTKPFPSTYQGISIFDGIFKNVTVRKNIVLSGAYHGISLNGVQTGLIEKNTIINTTDGRGLWIQAGCSKNGACATNMTIKYNLAPKFKSMSGSTLSNNYVVDKSTASQHFNLFDYNNGSYDFSLKPSSAFYATGAGAL